MTDAPTATPLSTGYAFTECPRWHDGRLWFVDMHRDQVLAVDLNGRAEVMAELPGRAGGLGWLPDGRLLAVVQDARQILRLDDDGFAVHADLSGAVASMLNDLWVDATGRAYAGEMGFDVHAFLRKLAAVAAPASDEAARPLELPATSRLFVVEPDGSWRVGAENFLFTNGIAVDEQTRTLIVAETFGARLSVFDLDADGSPRFRETWPLDFYPDGIGLDGRGAVWVADPANARAHRIAYGGADTASVASDQPCLACAVGEDDGQSLFLCTSPTTEPDEARARLESRIDIAALPEGARP